jgi:hypothetical protein
VKQVAYKLALNISSVFIIVIIIISGSAVLVRTLAASHWRFRSLIKILGRTPFDELSAHRKGFYLHRTTRHRNTKTNIHASSGIRTHYPSSQATKSYALDRVATRTCLSYVLKLIKLCKINYIKLTTFHVIVKTATSDVQFLVYKCKMCCIYDSTGHSVRILFEYCVIVRYTVSLHLLVALVYYIKYSVTPGDNSFLWCSAL